MFKIRFRCNARVKQAQQEVEWWRTASVSAVTNEANDKLIKYWSVVQDNIFQIKTQSLYIEYYIYVGDDRNRMRLPKFGYGLKCLKAGEQK